MKTCLLTLLLLLFVFTGFSQDLAPAEIKATYPGGDEQMMSYLKETVINKIYETSTTPRSSIPPTTVVFSVNEEGVITEAKISSTSKDPKIDRLFLDAIHNMPTWKPAENADGLKAKQELELSIPYSRGGC